MQQIFPNSSSLCDYVIILRHHNAAGTVREMCNEHCSLNSAINMIWPASWNCMVGVDRPNLFAFPCDSNSYLKYVIVQSVMWWTMQCNMIWTPIWAIWNWTGDNLVDNPTHLYFNYLFYFSVLYYYCSYLSVIISNWAWVFGQVFAICLMQRSMKQRSKKQKTIKQRSTKQTSSKQKSKKKKKYKTDKYK